MYKQTGVPGEMDGIIRQISVDRIDTLDVVDTNETLIKVYFDVSKVRRRKKQAVEEAITVTVLDAASVMFSNRHVTMQGWLDDSKKILCVTATFYRAKGLTHYKKKVQADA